MEVYCRRRGLQPYPKTHQHRREAREGVVSTKHHSPGLGHGIWIRGYWFRAGRHKRGCSRKRRNTISRSHSPTDLRGNKCQRFDERSRTGTQAASLFTIMQRSFHHPLHGYDPEYTSLIIIPLPEVSINWQLRPDMCGLWGRRF